MTIWPQLLKQWISLYPADKMYSNKTFWQVFHTIPYLKQTDASTLYTNYSAVGKFLHTFYLPHIATYPVDNIICSLNNWGLIGIYTVGLVHTSDRSHGNRITSTVPCKCKLTVPRNSNFATRSSILETRKLQVLRLESSASSIESSASIFVISFSHVLSEQQFDSFLREPSLQRQPTVFALLLEGLLRTCMHKLERVRSSSIFSAPCRLQPKVLCVFNQGNTVGEVLI